MSDGAGKYRRLLSAAVENISNAFYDAYVEVNCRVRSMAGLKVYVIRDEIANCCEWCSDLAGIYKYDDAPKEVWGRHEHCRCIVTTRTERGTYQDAWSRQEYRRYKDNRIAREKEILEEEGELRKGYLRKAKKLNPEYYDITKGYIEKARPGEGRVIQAMGFKKKRHKEEIDMAYWLLNTFGGEIIENADPRGHKFADYYWDSKLWELKTIRSSSYSTIDDHLRTGNKQIGTNRGGIIIDMTRNTQEDIPWMIKNVIESAKGRNFVPTDIMIKKGNVFRVIQTIKT